jgi:type II secretory pathway pseudopilin PulG
MVGGFTLMELIASILLLSIALPPLVVAMRDGVVRQAAVNQRAVARWLAHARLEEVIADRHSASRGYGAVVTGFYAAEAPVSGWPGFNRTVTITETGPNLSTAGTGYKVVTVTVTWRDTIRGASNLQIQTVLTDY